MTGDEMREQLAATLVKLWEDDAGESLDGVLDAELVDSYTDALLPVVRKIAADELRAAADWAATSAIDIRAACDHDRDRADALDPQ